MPARSVWGLLNWPGSSRIFTGRRWTTLTQLPVAFSGGKREKRAPVPAESESTLPRNTRSVKVSTQTLAGMPGRMRASCVSLKFARTQTSCSGTMARRGCPIWATWPSSTVRRETTPSTRARTSVYCSWSSAKLRSARAWARAASARTMSACFIGTWPRWLSVLASVPRSSITRCFACCTPCVLETRDASACCTSRSACVLRRSVASCTARAAFSAVSACSKSRSATRPDWTSLRWRSISRRACRALALAPVASAAAAAAEATGAKANALQALREMERQRKLVQSGLVALRDFEQAETAENAARAVQEATERRKTQAEREVQQAEASLVSRTQGVQQAKQRVMELRGTLAKTESQRGQVPMKEADIVRAEAALAQARADLNFAELQLQYTEVRAL